MKLKRFKVTGFRSVEDSGWIETDEVTALIGTNESGKSNLLLPLWKLNPAKGGGVHPTSDYPRKRFTAIRAATKKPVFIEAVFAPDDSMRERLAQLTGFEEQVLVEVTVLRRLDGAYEIDFPLGPKARTVPLPSVGDLLQSALSEIASMEPLDTEGDLKAAMLAALTTAKGSLPVGQDCSLEQLSAIQSTLSAVGAEADPKSSSSIVPRFKRVRESIKSHHGTLSKPHPRDSKEVKDAIVAALPKFVYYSNYGNLDSEIYLPHVIDNLKRDNLGQRELAKARTLKVLFEFVNLKPDEILSLGKETHAAGQQPTPEQVEASALKKKERSILLQSASTRLTEEFRRWWKQGDYRFRFEADGDHFRIWVSDDRRPEEVELEGRSTGLQWFLSFYLVFLVESDDTHSGCILLLDEPGHSLHPLAQRDLSDFFDGLADHNQLLYTTHSPFLVDADRLDRARKVFVAPDGTSKATPDLGADGGDPTKKGAGYAVHAALGLSVAESLILGCEPIVVEGPSDQHYLTAIKTLLISAGSLKPGRELVFPPAGGAKGVKAVASVLAGRDDALPIVLLDSDEQGTKFADSLRAGLYVDSPQQVLQVGSYVTFPGAEVEDLIPAAIVAEAVDRMIRAPEIPFQRGMVPNKPIIPQVEAWAKRHGVELEKGWKVELAKRVKRTLLEGGATSLPPGTLETWTGVFGDFSPAEAASPALEMAAS